MKVGILIQGHHTWGPGIRLRKLVVLALIIHQTFNLKLYCLKYVFSPKENLYLFSYSILHQPHGHKYA
jgi:hypothetical protein